MTSLTVDDSSFLSRKGNRKTSPYPMIPVPEAVRMALTETAQIVWTQPTLGSQTVSVSESEHLIHHTLSEDVLQQSPGYPPYRASIMDGYAIHSSSISNNSTTTFRIVGKLLTGDTSPSVPDSTSQTNKHYPPALYVTTGAMVPEEYDTVVPIEACTTADDDDETVVEMDVKERNAKKWIRPIGCDTASGSLVLAKGSIITPSALGLLHQAGVSQVSLQSPVIVGLLSTGNELHDGVAWEKRKTGTIPDVNRPILDALLKEWSHNGGGSLKVVNLGVAADSDPDRLTQILQADAKKCHIVITTGGISMGETDIVQHVLVERLQGAVKFGRLNMKPGKPTTLVRLPDHRLVFALPGNPVSAVVCAHLLVRPCLELYFRGPSTSVDNYGDTLEEQIRRTVENAWLPGEVQATLTHDVPLDPERPEYLRVTLERDPALSSQATFRATSTGVQRSSRLMSLRDAQGLMVLPAATPERPTVRAGESFVVLWMGDHNPFLPSTQVRSSLHLSIPKPSFLVRIIVLVSSNNSNESRDPPRIEDDLRKHLSQAVPAAMAGSKSGAVEIVTKNGIDGYDGSLEDQRFVEYLHSFTENADFVVILSSEGRGSFRRHAQAAACLRRNLSKCADSVALQLRLGVASQEAKLAHWETVAGYLSPSFVLLLPEQGLHGGLSHVRGLIKHATKIARGSSGSKH